MSISTSRPNAITLACLLALAVLDVRGAPTSTLSAPINALDPSEAAQIRIWQMRQLQLYQLRSTILSESLSRRLSSSPTSANIVPTVKSVSTIDGSQPIHTDWDCTISTLRHPKSCLYSFDAPPNSKVVAPVGTTQWISLGALNRLRRLDPTKVEPMWHNQYLIHKSWFGTESTSLLQHVGIKGWFISSVLLDRPYMLRSMLVLTVAMIIISILPILEYAFNFGILNSKFVWERYNNWGKFYHAAFPFKLLLAQMAWKFVATKFDSLQRKVLDHIVDMECAILEESVPVTLKDDDEIEADFHQSEEDVVDAMVEEDEQETLFEDESENFESDQD